MKNQEIKDIPKVMLHEHLEGSITPDTAKKIAKRHNLDFPDDLIYKEGEYSKEEFPHGRYNYKTFMEFIGTYDKISGFLLEAEDFYIITKDLIEREVENNLRYMEIIIYPEIMFNVKMTNEAPIEDERYKSVLENISKAIKECEGKFDVVVKLVATGVRHMPVERMIETAKYVLDHKNDLIVGFGIASNENAGEFADYKETHELIANANLNKSYHAGEVRNSQSIKDALACGSTRIGHGISIIDDKDLLEEVAEKQILLEISPTSNKILVEDLEYKYENHPIRKIYDAGVKLCLNTDDSGMFGTDLQKEYEICHKHFSFSRIELLDMSLNGIEEAFADEKTKEKIIKNIYLEFNDNDIDELSKAIEKTTNKFLKNRLVRRLEEASSL